MSTAKQQRSSTWTLKGTGNSSKCTSYKFLEELACRSRYDFMGVSVSVLEFQRGKHHDFLRSQQSSRKESSWWWSVCWKRNRFLKFPGGKDQSRSLQVIESKCRGRMSAKTRTCWVLRYPILWLEMEAVGAAMRWTRAEKAMRISASTSKVHKHSLKTIKTIRQLADDSNSNPAWPCLIFLSTSAHKMFKGRPHTHSVTLFSRDYLGSWPPQTLRWQKIMRAYLY